MSCLYQQWTASHNTSSYTYHFPSEASVEATSAQWSHVNTNLMIISLTETFLLYSSFGWWDSITIPIVDIPSNATTYVIICALIVTCQLISSCCAVGQETIVWGYGTCQVEDVFPSWRYPGILYVIMLCVCVLYSSGK